MKKRILISLLMILITFTACNKATPTTVPATVTPAIPPTPTATEIPLALRVNGEGITLEEYQADLARLQQAQTELGISATPEEQRSRVLTNFEDELMMAQAAVKSGFNVDDATLQARIDKLISDIGGAEKLSTWQVENGYTDASFRAALRRSILATWQRDQIIEAVPTTAEQVHARQILFQDEANATYAYQLLQDGKDFATLAYTYDPTLGGDIGWFTLDGLTQPNVAQAAFAIQPGEYTEIVQSEIGYHIVYVIEREADHELSVDARRELQEKALADWLIASRAASTIEELAP